MRYDTVLFDLGSTLINYDNASWDELGRLGCANACPLLKGIAEVEVTPERLWDEFHYAIDRMAVGHNEDFTEIDLTVVTNEILTKLGITSLDGLANRFINAYYQPITTQVSLLPGAREVLSRFKGAGVKIGLVSNTIFPANFHRQEMTRFGIFDCFDFMIFSSEFKFRKPKPEIFLKALELAKTKPERAIFVGDRLVEDIGGPQAVGIRGVLKRVDDRDYTAPIEPYKTITELRELLDIVLG